MKKTYYSNGKLLLTGEYVVLDGAKALALPTKFGQYLHVENGENSQILWKSYDNDGTIWFEDVITFDEIINQDNNAETEIKKTLIRILHKAYTQNPDYLTCSEGYLITTELTFPRLWGLGTSSTLINNIAQWLNIDAYKLLRESFGGSGYDIACAQNATPILYQLDNNRPIIESVDYQPCFADQLYFVYLNRKQSSKSAIEAYNKKRSTVTHSIEKINKITAEILSSGNSADFAELVETHENILSAVLETKPVKEILFPDFEGSVKSLGAWGGDFVLVVSAENPKEYFEQKGYYTILPYNDMIK